MQQPILIHSLDIMQVKYSYTLIHMRLTWLCLKHKVRLRVITILATIQKKTCSPKINGPILTECNTIKNVVVSAAEVEICGFLHNAQISIPIRFILNVLGHPQPPTPIKTDNSTIPYFIYDNINLKKAKSWDMK